jgi:hypothetical protein
LSLKNARLWDEKNNLYYFFQDYDSLSDRSHIYKKIKILSFQPIRNAPYLCFMQNRDKDAGISSLQLACCAQCEEDLEQLVVFELIVPRAAKVASPRPQPEVGPLTLRENSITTTVPGKLYVQLQASNTATRAGWCMTATLSASSQTGLISL